MARILVIDDSAENRQLFDYVLRHFGHETFLAANGEEGIAAALREHPDLAIIDLVMPGMRGEEVARRLRAVPELAGMRLLAVSVGLDAGRVPELDAGRVPEGDFDGWYPLPLDPETLARDIEAYLSSVPPA